MMPFSGNLQLQKKLHSLYFPCQLGWKPAGAPLLRPLCKCSADKLVAWTEIQNSTPVKGVQVGVKIQSTQLPKCIQVELLATN